MRREAIVTDAPRVARPLLSRPSSTVLDIRDGPGRIDARRVLIVAASSAGWHRAVTGLRFSSACDEVRLFALEGLRPAPIDALFDWLEDGGFRALDVGHGSHDRVGVLRVVFRRSPQTTDIGLVRELAAIVGRWPRTPVVGPRVAVASPDLVTWAPTNVGTSLLRASWETDDSERRRASPDVLVVGAASPADPPNLRGADALKAEGVPILGVGALDPAWASRCDLIDVDAVGPLSPSWPTIDLPATPGVAAEAVDRIRSMLAGGTSPTGPGDPRLLGDEVATALAARATASGLRRLRSALLRQFAPCSWWSRYLARLDVGWNAHARVLAVVGQAGATSELRTRIARQTLVPERTVVVPRTPSGVRRALESCPEDIVAFWHLGSEPPETYVEEAVLLLGLLGASAVVSPRRFLRAEDALLEAGSHGPNDSVAMGSLVARTGDLQRLRTFPEGGLGFERRLVTSLTGAGGAVHRHADGPVIERLYGERIGLRRSFI